MHKVVCYTCGVEGHQCPRLQKGEVAGSKDARPKPVKRVWHSQPRCVQLIGEVDGHVVPILLDSGASISVVPESMVAPERLAGCTVAVRPFGAKEPMVLPIASVPFKIGELEWEERVAVAPKQEGVEEEVLYGLDLNSERGLDLVLLVNKARQPNVLRVTTRAQADTEKQTQQREAREIAVEKPKAKALDSLVISQDLGSEPEATVSSTGNTPARDEEVEELEDIAEERYQLRKEKRGEPELVIPPVNKGKGDRAALVAEVRSDPTLKGWRELAGKGENGFSWEKDLLYKDVSTHVLDVVQLLVLPKGFRSKVLELAHEGMNHMGARRVTALLRQRFAWPGMGQDVIRHCRSCPTCQQCAKAPARKVPMQERDVLSEPFESVAVDIVGPLPKGKGGCRFLLTAVCMASRWPEAIPLRSITAKAVSEGLVDMFARTGIPLRLISDQGTQFVGAVVKRLCQSLHIDKIQTTPYHPEGNGVVECMHSTLGAMLTKAASQGLDWVGQIPFALFALRAAPNRDTLFSPFELVMGRQVRTPLDILYQGWAQLDFQELDTGEWVEWLVDRLSCWHEVMRERSVEASKERKKYFDRGKLDRVLEVGDLVLCRVPGMAHKLAEAWHGPYKVVEKMNKVDFKVEVGCGRTKVLHINNIKKFQVREEEVMRLSVMAEDCTDDEDIGIKLRGTCADFDASVVLRLQEEYQEMFSNLPGKTNVCSLAINTGDSPPIASGPYRVPDMLKGEVKVEIENLLELGVAEPRHSPWASPIVPVLKKDGCIRLCIDYRRLNNVTVGDPYYMVTLDEILEKVGHSRSLISPRASIKLALRRSPRRRQHLSHRLGNINLTECPLGYRMLPLSFRGAWKQYWGVATTVLPHTLMISWFIPRMGWTMLWI